MDELWDEKAYICTDCGNSPHYLAPGRGINE